MTRVGRVLLVLGMCSLCASARAQEPRLPAPAVTPDDRTALIQRARSLAAAGSHRDSAATWQTVAARESALASYATRESIRASIAAGDIDAAQQGLTGLGASAPADLLLAAADSCRTARAYDCATSLYRRSRQAAGRTRTADAAALGLAEALERSGKPGEALAAYRDLQLTFAEARAYDAAVTAIRRLTPGADATDRLTESHFDTIVDRLAGVAAFRRAVEIQDQWLKTFPDTARRPHIEAAAIQHLYALRANAEARARAALYFTRHGDGGEAHKVRIVLFRLDVREGLTADVERHGRAIMNGDVPGATLEDQQDAARLLAEYLVSVGQPSRALGVYDRLYAMTTGRRARIDVLWRMAIASLRAGNRTRASNELRQLLRLKPDSETERAATFWLGYALGADTSTRGAASRAHWSSLVRRFPFSYYGVRASARLGVELPPPALTFPELTLDDTVLAHADYQAAALLSRAGLLADAAIYARRLTSVFRRDAAVALLAARASEAAGDYASCSTVMSSHFGPYLQEPAANLPDDFWALAYPRAFWPEVSAAARRHSVDPLLMIGLARQESHFDRMARSPVGAIGLFQVMPYTAVELDPTFADPAALERLVEADVSAELGAMHLAGTLKRFGGAVAPSIASYNADKERVQVWWDAAKGLPEELFIDSIPYQQTRAYVRQVLTNYWMYQRSARSPSPRK